MLPMQVALVGLHLLLLLLLVVAALTRPAPLRPICLMTQGGSGACRLPPPLALSGGRPCAC